MQIDWPFQIGADGRTAETTDDDHVHDLIMLMLFTNPGERVMRPEFGTGLMQHVFAPNSPELAAVIELTVRAALQRWLGDVVEVRELTVEAVEAELRANLAYVLRATGEEVARTFVRPVS